jgi:hypothetical protein
MASKIRGYDVAFTHRGSWRAYRRLRGAIVDEVPVAWNTGWKSSKPPTLTFWTKDPLEARALVESGRPFVVAVAQKKGPSVRSDDISGLFDVIATEAISSPYHPEYGSAGGVLCAVLRPCKEAE